MDPCSLNTPISPPVSSNITSPSSPPMIQSKSDEVIPMKESNSDQLFMESKDPYTESGLTKPHPIRNIDDRMNLECEEVMNIPMAFPVENQIKIETPIPLDKSPLPITFKPGSQIEFHKDSNSAFSEVLKNSKSSFTPLLKASSIMEVDSNFSLQKTEDNIIPNRPRFNSIGNDKYGLSGLFALLKVVNEIDENPKEGNNWEKPPEQLCENRFCPTPRDQMSGWSRKKINGVYIWLCHNCSKAYNSKQYCEYCKQIYTDTSDTNAIVDGLDWIPLEVGFIFSSCNPGNPTC